MNQLIHRSQSACREEDFSFSEPNSEGVFREGISRGFRMVFEFATCTTDSCYGRYVTLHPHRRPRNIGLYNPVGRSVTSKHICLILSRVDLPLSNLTVVVYRILRSACRCGLQPDITYRPNHCGQI